MASYVILWENNTSGHRAVKGKTWPGHAAMNIGDSFKQTKDEPYVSWWPSTGASFSVPGIIGGVLTPKVLSSAGESHQTLVMDIKEETYLPDHIIRLKTTNEQEQKMVGAWKEIRMRVGGEFKTKYHALRQNCSTIVSRVLHAGGYHSHKWSVDTNWAWSPADVRVLLRGKGSYTQWNDFLTVLKESGIEEATIPVKQARSGILCTTGAPCRFQNEGKGFHWRNK